MAFDVSGTESVHDNLVFGTDLPDRIFDQRGTPYNRIANGGIDMGAYERQMFAPSLFVVTTSEDELDPSSRNVSLREAIDSANADPDPNVITFAASLAGQTIELEAGEIEIRDAVTIDGSELVAPITIDAGSRSRIFSITSTADDVTLRSLALAGGNAADGIADGGGEDGGTIRSATHGQLSLEGVSITGSRAGDGGHPVPYSSLPGGPGGRGGAIHAAGDVWLIRSTISGSSAGKGGNPYDPFVDGGVGGNGGGVHAAGNVTLIESHVSGNSAGDGGSGTYSGDAGSGGGIWAEGTVTLIDSTVTGNRAGIRGYQAFLAMLLADRVAGSSPEASSRLTGAPRQW